MSAARQTPRPETAGRRDGAVSGPALLEAIVLDLADRVAELERVRGVGDADRVLTLAEVAVRIGKSPETIKRHWLRTNAARRMHRLELLLFQDASGRWLSTPRMIQRWFNAFATETIRTVRGGRVSNSRDHIAPPVRRREMAKTSAVSRSIGQAPPGGGANGEKA